VPRLSITTPGESTNITAGPLGSRRKVALQSHPRYGTDCLT
jgi:hypothetical protein